MRMRKRKWVDSFLQEEKEYLITDGLNYSNYYLEIGMGMGDFICESCRLNPDSLYIGLEKDATCVARSIKKAQSLKLDNLKISHADAEHLLDFFKPHTCKGIYLHFSDPWPKKRNHKRRLTYPTFLAKYEELLNDTGFIVFKTDNLDLFNDSLLYFQNSNLKLVDVNRDYHSIKRAEPMTAYERKFVEANMPIYYAKLTK